MRFEADLLFEVNLGGRLEALYRLFFLLAKELLDGMAHAFGFYRGLGFSLDPKPGLPAWSIANVFHGILPIFLPGARIANLGQVQHYQRRTACRQGWVHGPE
jgi:hypothetical protein